MNKERIIKTIQDLPENFTTEELIQRIIAIEKIEAGKKQAIEGQTTDFDAVKARFERKWSK